MEAATDPPATVAKPAGTTCDVTQDAYGVTARRCR
jgi:hypothetical protein